MRGALSQVLKARWVRAALGLAVAAGCAAAVGAAGRAANQPDVISVRLGGDTAVTRIVVDLRRATSGALEAAATPGEVSVLLKDASAPNALRGPGRGVIRGWRIADAPGGARLKLDVAGKAAVARRFLLPPADGVVDYRYVVDLAARPGEAAPAAAAAPAARTLSSEALPAGALRPAIAKDADLPVFGGPPRAVHARKIIVIDPGHGGRDSGALGADSFEKNVTLATALALKARLESTGRYQVVMTRQADVFVPLEQRVQIARRAGADLFLSLHADSAGDAATHGASVYTLSEGGEQRVGYVLGQHEWFLQQAVNGDDQAVGQILLDLTERTTRNRSASFARALIERVGDRAPLLPRSRRDAGYFVLLAPDVPAALLEMGFITNPGDEERLNDPQQRQALVGKIAQAIDGYFAGRTRIAAR